MAEELTQEHIDNAERLAKNRAVSKKDLAGAALGNPAAEAKVAAKLAGNILKKFGEHWLIFLGVAPFFDLIALIPLVSVITNPIFGGILFLYFGSKKGGMGPFGLSMLVLVGMIVDAITGFIPIADLLPVNMAVAAIRIIWEGTEETIPGAKKHSG